MADPALGQSRDPNGIGDDMSRKLLTICIVGNNGGDRFAQCVNASTRIARDVVCIDGGLDEASRSMAEALGVRFAESDALTDAVETEWVLFLNSSEVPFLSRDEATLDSLLRNGSPRGYLIHAKKRIVREELRDFQLIQNLDQFGAMGNRAYVSVAEPRLVRRHLARQGMLMLNSETPGECPGAFEEVLTPLSIGYALDPPPETDGDGSIDYERRCLNGEVYYGPGPEDGIDELGSGFIGFRVVHEGYLGVLKEIAQLGMGTDIMFVPMLRFLVENGEHGKARDLFEHWEHKNSDKGSFHLQMAGGQIYTGLLMVDEAIDWYRKALATYADPWICARIGDLYLIGGDRRNAVEFYTRYLKEKRDTFYEQVLSTISADNWRPKRLSVCMIARDEEETIGKALESIQHIADEILVVDTGSVDRTADIARAYGGTVIESEWHDDFSAARNLAIERATGDYALVLDADEFVDINDRFDAALMKRVLPSDEDTAFNVKMAADRDAESMSVSLIRSVLQEEIAEERQLRLFPLGREVRFEGEAFECVTGSVKRQGIKVVDMGLFSITHARGNGSRRDQRKIPAVIRASDSMGDAARLVNGGMFFLKMGDMDSAYPWFDKIEEADPKLISQVALLYSLHGQPARAKKLVQRGLNSSPESANLTFMLAKICYGEGRYSEVRQLLSPGLERVIEDLDAESAAEAAYYSGMALLEAADLPKGAEHIALASEKDPLNTRYKMAGLLPFAEADRWQELLEFTGQVVGDEKVDIDFEVRGFGDAGLVFVKLYEHFVDAGRQEEADISQRIIERIVVAGGLTQEDIGRMVGINGREQPSSGTVGS